MNEAPDLLASPKRLALRPAEAAQALAISERLLWSKTKAGEIPHFQMGRATLYPVEQLRDWLAAQAEQNAEAQKKGGAE